MEWKYGKKWVYSITYDEGLAALVEFALPFHREYGIPGHVCLVASQIGVPRNVPGSSYDGMRILSRHAIRALVREGWGVSCHSMTHAAITDENAEVEVVEARETLEEAIGLPVTMFCVPGNNEGHPPAMRAADRAGYRAIMTIYDRVNTHYTGLLSLGRCPLHTEYPAPYYSTYDPYKRIHQAMDTRGWIIDYCHCPMPDKPIHPAKDCTTQELEKRFETVVRLGGDDVWLAEPNEVVAWLVEERRGALPPEPAADAQAHRATSVLHRFKNHKK